MSQYLNDSIAPVSRQVEQQNFSVFGCFDGQLFFFADGRAVSLVQLLAVQLDFSLRDLEPRVTLGGERLRDLLSRRKQSNEQLRVLIDLYRTLGAVARSDQAKLAALLRFGKSFLFVAGFVPLLVGENPDLQQMHGFG